MLKGLGRLEPVHQGRDQPGRDCPLRELCWVSHTTRAQTTSQKRGDTGPQMYLITFLEQRVPTVSRIEQGQVCTMVPQLEWQRGTKPCSKLRGTFGWDVVYWEQNSVDRNGKPFAISQKPPSFPTKWCPAFFLESSLFLFPSPRNSQAYQQHLSWA